MTSLCIVYYCSTWHVERWKTHHSSVCSGMLLDADFLLYSYCQDSLCVGPRKCEIFAWVGQKNNTKMKKSEQTFDKINPTNRWSRSIPTEKEWIPRPLEKLSLHFILEIARRYYKQTASSCFVVYAHKSKFPMQTFVYA